MTHQKRATVPGRCPFKKGPRYDRTPWVAKNRRQRRWLAREKLERMAYDFRLEAIPGESTKALRVRLMDTITPACMREVRRVNEQLQRTIDAADPTKATGADLAWLAGLYGVERRAPAAQAGDVDGQRVHVARGPLDAGLLEAAEVHYVVGGG